MTYIARGLIERFIIHRVRLTRDSSGRHGVKPYPVFYESVSGARQQISPKIFKRSNRASMPPASPSGAATQKRAVTARLPHHHLMRIIGAASNCGSGNTPWRSRRCPRIVNAVNHKPALQKNRPGNPITELKLQLIANTAAVFLLVLPAMAQDASVVKSNGLNCAAYSMPQPNHWDRLNAAAKASDLIGMTVENRQSEKLGRVADFAVDIESGQIVEVIVSRDDYLEPNTTFIAVPPEILHRAAGQKVLHLDASMATINGAPGFDAADWNQCTESNRVTEVYSHYGVHPYFVAEHGEYRTTSVDGISASSLPRNMDGAINTTGGRAMDTVHNEEIANELEETNNPILTQYPDGTWTTNYFKHEDGSISRWANLVYVQKVSKLMGMQVRKLPDEKPGKVENFVLDLPAGRIVAVIIASGELTGMGYELSAVPPTALIFNAQQDTLQLDAFKETSTRFRRFQTDAAVTAEIRREINAENDMSTNAKNIQINTLDGRVTLRGPVNSAGERRIIGDIADRIATAANVNNHLAVLITTSSIN
jgi:sporulation protein YlmC with PRC-barrel domain